MRYYVYVLQSLADGNFYTGYTNDLEKRLAEHQNGKVFSTNSRRPFKLIYYEFCLCFVEQLSEISHEKRESVIA